MYASISNQGGSATLTSPPVSHLQTQCLTFFFLRGGSGVTLRLLEYHITTNRYSSSLWQSNETHLVDEWIRVQQDLTITDSVNVIFEARKIGKCFLQFNFCLTFLRI